MTGPLQARSVVLPELVAHRGNAADFPENTLPAFASALDGGIRWVELDVQLSADGVPFVVHDAHLERTTRSSGDLRLLPASALDDVDAGEPQRFGELHRGVKLPRLQAFAGLLARHPAARAFIELKRASLAHHGAVPCLERVLDALAAVADRCVPISFDAAAVAAARAATGRPVGWVIDRFDAASQQTLASLRPEYVFYDYLKLPPGDASLPPGPWRWAAYEVKDAARALAEVRRGAALVESMAPLHLLAGLQSALAQA
ncbi:MAG: glycerophosphodiester phosphodiesterase [Proteobacteria bacterium]|nr:glycerophosphodiester phosphodiesterase [Pseudomonadota bacterium]